MDPSQPPAPVVRVRPKTQTTAPISVPATAPQDAAPLANRLPRPRPINPLALSGATGSIGQPSTANTRPRATAPAQAATGTTGQTAATTAPKARATRPPTSAASASAAFSADSTAPAKPTPPKPTISATGLNRSVIVLDPGHGGADSGSRIGDSTLEKNVTLALAFRLRSLLIARGFTVVLTRENDAATEGNAANTPLTLDDRAGIANHAHAAACLLLHATGRGDGVHLYSSGLDPAVGEATQLPWLTAQAAWIPASEQLERSVSSALGRSHIALVSSTASVRPVDSLACPALVLELAPETSDVGSINDVGYGERVASAVAGALVFWQSQVQAPPRLNLIAPTPHIPHHHPAPAIPPARPVSPGEPQP